MLVGDAATVTATANELGPESGAYRVDDGWKMPIC